MQYIHPSRVREFTGYTESAITDWARKGLIPARKEGLYWFIGWPLPADFKPRSRPFRRNQDRVLDVVDVPEPMPSAEEAAPQEPPPYTDQDVARALMELVIEARAQTEVLVHLTRDVLPDLLRTQIAEQRNLNAIAAGRLGEMAETLLPAMIAQQQRLADAWEKPTPPNGVLDRMLGRHG